MSTTSNFPVTLLYDGSCPVCAFEMGNLHARDDKNRLVLIDIAAPGFDPQPFGASLADMMALIHAVRPDGTLAIGVPALQLAYQAVGLGAWVAPTQWPILSPMFDWMYRWFANNRYGLSRALAPLINRIAAARDVSALKALQRTQACHTGRCTSPDQSTQKQGML